MDRKSIEPITAWHLDPLIIIIILVGQPSQYGMVFTLKADTSSLLSNAFPDTEGISAWFSGDRQLAC